MGIDATGCTVHEGCDHIFFIGFLGAGKSTLARNLGQLFGRSYVDTDRLVERSLGKSIAGIYGEDGEQIFRDAETVELRRLKSRKSLLVSCGGGIVEHAINCELMHEMGTIVYLEGELEDSLRNIQSLVRRPDMDRCKDIRQLYGRLRPLYEKAADVIIDIRGRSFEEVTNNSAALLWEKGLL